jgi:hypothetical protein
MHGGHFSLPGAWPILLAAKAVGLAGRDGIAGPKTPGAQGAHAAPVEREATGVRDRA